MRQTIESELVMNQLPHPKYFNGVEWHTRTRSTRKDIPTYLHSDLPSLRFAQIKHKFQEMNSINCPRLSFFDQMIHCRHKKQPKATTKSRLEENKIKKQKQLKTIREELKYALIMSDRKSNVIINLVERANKIEAELNLKGRATDTASLFLNNKKNVASPSRKPRSYFNDTIDIVFSVRKKEQLDKIFSDRRTQIPSQQQPEKADQQIKLLSFQEDDD